MLIMSTQVEALRDLYVEVAGEETVTERQIDVGSRDPIEKESDPSDEVTQYVRENGLEDALDGAEVDS